MKNTAPSQCSCEAMQRTTQASILGGQACSVGKGTGRAVRRQELLHLVERHKDVSNRDRHSSMFRLVLSIVF